MFLTIFDKTHIAATKYVWAYNNLHMSIRVDGGFLWTELMVF